MSQYKSLFSELQVGAVKIRNRITMSALTRSRSVPTNVPTAVNVEYYVQRAAGGTGLIVSEGVLVAQQGSEWQHAPGIWNSEQVAGWKKVTDAVHAHGSAIFVQLWHLGRASHPDAPEQKEAGTPVYAPSAVSARGGKFRFIPGAPGYVTPTEIDDPWKLVALFKQAAINAKEAGFDGAEVHGANGYLVHQFLDSTSNKRADEWGGSVEKRSKFGLEVIKAVAEVFGADRTAVKVSPAGGYNDMGMPLDETLATFTYFIKQADALKLGYICLARYGAKLDVTFDGQTRATQHDVLASYRSSITNSKLILNVDVSPAEAETLISSGQIDAVAFGWFFIMNPDLAKRLQEGKELSAEVDFTTLYGHDHVSEEETRKGYTDYPFATDVKV